MSGLLRDTAAAQSRQSRVHCSGRGGEREGLSRDQTQARAAASRDTEPGDRGTDRALAVTQWGLSESGVSELRFSEDHKLQTLDSTSRTNISVGGIS